MSDSESTTDVGIESSSTGEESSSTVAPAGNKALNKPVSETEEPSRSAGSGSATLIVSLGENLNQAVGGAAGKPVQIAFLLGAWGAIASSMLGVWQSVPYLFGDCVQLLRRDSTADNAAGAGTPPERHPVYRQSLFAMATVPAVGLFQKFDLVQLAYAVVGAAFLPLLAAVLNVLNGRVRTIGQAAKNSVVTSVLLAAVLVFFTWAGFYDVRKRIRKTQAPKQPPVSAVSQVSQTGTSNVLLRPASAVRD